MNLSSVGPDNGTGRVRRQPFDLESEGRLRILHVIGAMDRGGVETWLLHILRRIDRARYQMDFLVHHDRRFDFSDEIESLGSRILVGGDHRHWGSYSRRFSEVIRTYGPYDVVHSHVWRFSGFVARLARREGVPARIAHSHMHCEAEWASASWSRRAYFALMATWIQRYVTVGLAASVPAASDLFGPSWQSDPRFRVLSYGLDFEPFRAPVDRTAVRDELGIPRDAFVIGHVGRLTRQKNHEMLLKIAEAMAPNIRPCASCSSAGVSCNLSSNVRSRRRASPAA